jgi:hypothetical protein
MPDFIINETDSGTVNPRHPANAFSIWIRSLSQL